jgi:hypothetical protein
MALLASDILVPRRFSQTLRLKPQQREDLEPFSLEIDVDHTRLR